MTGLEAPEIAGWRLTAPIVNLPGARRTGGTYVAAIPDPEAARKAIPFGRAVPSAPLAPLFPADLARYGVAAGEVKQIA